MPHLQLVVAWAVPVKPDALGGHLQAHIDTLPTIETLRLCHSFGRGSNVFVTKLPVELRHEIETYVVHDARKETVPEWHQKFRCYLNRCKSTDHEDDGWYQDEHEDQAQQWYRRLAWDKGYFAQHAKLVRKHFGLTIWVAETQLKQEEDDDDDNASKKPTTTAYLTLPGHSTASKSYSLHTDLKDQWDWSLESGYGLPLALGARDTDASLARFGRVMRILGLVPFQGPGTTKKPLTASLAGEEGTSDHDEQEGKVERVGGKAHAVRPRLTLLVVSEVEGGRGSYLPSP
ncbi:hypothetical protein LTR36_002519 [Oleoguttula mirabilis]|uniref:Uncharacterized protein n=1 Tax=Oleoguttula mirabilis TaxID=1507867 RepID=A0AAV9JN61_9PEZI|nr:hypothetical protein LTR36_002519 [Oleoguttula mirabilis]